MTETPDHQRQPRVPGVRYRTETRYRPVTTRVFGEEEIDYEPYDVDVPVPHRDWDGALMRLLLAVALGSTAVAVVWSTAGISSLLSLVVTTTGIAVAAASLFELLWIVCLVAEWLMRGRPDRAKPMRIAGWVAVLVVVAAMVLDGVHKDQVAAGIVGGAVSLMAKGSWWVVFRVRHVELRRPIANALQRKLEDLAATEALLGFKTQIGGRQAYADLVFGQDEANAARAAVEAGRQLDPGPSGPRPDPSGRPDDAESAPPAPVQPPAAMQPPAAPVVPQPVQTTAPVPPAEPPAPAPTVLMSVAAATRQVIAEQGEDISDQDLIEAVGERVGKERAASPKFPETVLRYRRAKDVNRKSRSRSAQ
ncbi:hypothetical protein [Streptomyces parvulus]|uniref:hypothetical protein n=1 Tax=Streptomyces parvulus TaxID=146923 RepID=UPI00382773A9